MGAPAAYGGLRSARWLRSFRHGPMVVAFRNLESGQVLFSQTLHPQQFYIDQQFRWPNWQNKKPTLRRDIWRAMAVAELPNHESAVQLYKNLVRLRELRDMYQRTQARDWRRKSKEGNIWYWNQYRPTYTHEAVADIVSALEALKPESSKLYWENEYRRGDDVHWKTVNNVEHHLIPKHNPREQPVVLNELRMASYERARALQADATRTAQEAAKVAQEAGEPTRKQLRAESEKARHEKLVKLSQNRTKQREQLFEQRPELKALNDKLEAVGRAEDALHTAEAAYDHFLPHGKRGAAKAPIKLRQRALRQSKRVYRMAKHRVAGLNNKRRVPQPRARMKV